MKCRLLLLCKMMMGIQMMVILRLDSLMEDHSNKNHQLNQLRSMQMMKMLMLNQKLRKSQMIIVMKLKVRRLKVRRQLVRRQLVRRQQVRRLKVRRLRVMRNTLQEQQKNQKLKLRNQLLKNQNQYQRIPVLNQYYLPYQQVMISHLLRLRMMMISQIHGKDSRNYWMQLRHIQRNHQIWDRRMKSELQVHTSISKFILNWKITHLTNMLIWRRKTWYYS